MNPPIITDWQSCLVYADWIRDTSGDEVNAAYWQLVGEVRRVLDPVIEQLRGNSVTASHKIRLPHGFRLHVKATARLLYLSLWDYRLPGEITHVVSGGGGYITRYQWRRFSTAPKRHYSKRTHQLVRKMFDILYPPGSEFRPS